MPATRFGPDVSDDAAYIMNQLLDLQDALEARQRGVKIDNKMLANLRKRERSARRLAKEVFGLTDDEINKRQFGLLQKIGQYGNRYRRVSTRKFDPTSPTGFRYTPGKRKEIARDWRSGKQLTRSVADEFTRRSGALKNNEGRTQKPDVADRIKRGGAQAGQTYRGFTNPKGRQQAIAELLRLQAGRQAIIIGGRRRALRSELDLDNLGIAKAPRIGAPRRGPASVPVSRRPAKAKSKQGRARRAAKRTGGVAPKRKRKP